MPKSSLISNNVGMDAHPLESYMTQPAPPNANASAPRNGK